MQSRHSTTGRVARPARRIATVLVIGASIMVCGLHESGAQDCRTTLRADDAHDGGQLGWAVDAYDGIAVVGSSEQNQTVPGSARVMDLVTGAQLFELVEPPPASEPGFGLAVAIGPAHVAIGAPRYGAQAGSVHVYDPATGELLRTLQASDATADDQFGSSVAIGGDLLVVGAPNAGTAGAAYVFDVVSGKELQHLRAMRAPSGADFGESVATDGTSVVVGASGDNAKAGTRSGAAYVFDGRSGRLLRRVVPTLPGDSSVTVPRSGVSFGVAVAVDDDRLLVGSYADDDGGEDAGAAYLFELPSGRLVRKLIPEDAAAADFFGLSVALRGDFAAVSALADERREAAGLVYVFDARTAEPIATLPPEFRGPGSRFGWSLAMDAERLVVGIPFDGSRGNYTGAIELFRLDELPGTPVVLVPEPTVTVLRYEFTLPGLGTFVFVRKVVGRIVAEMPLDCGSPQSFRVTDLELRPQGPEPPIEIAPGVTITLNEPGIELAEPGPTSPIAADGSFSQNLQVRLTGSVQYTFPTGTGSIDMNGGSPMTFPYTGNAGRAGGGLTLDVEMPRTTGVIDIGLGDLNPTYAVSATRSAESVLQRFFAATPSQTLKARVDLDFSKDSADRTKFSGRFDRTMPPELREGSTAVLRVGAYRADVVLDAKGRTPKGSAVAVKLKVKKKKAIFKVSVRKADLRAAFAALPDAETLPRTIAWSLTFPDGWNIEGLLEMDGKDRLRTSGDGELSRARLSMKKRKPTR